MTPPDDSDRPARRGARADKDDAEPPPRARGRDRGRARRPADGASTDEAGILANLPSTRPQRPSARRATAKRAAAERSHAKQSTPKPRAKPQPKPKPTAERKPSAAAERRAAKRAPAPPRAVGHPRRAPKPLEPPIPRQGFETEDEIEQGTPVHPPTRPEMAAAVVELFGELAQSGLTTGGRLLKDALGRLPGV